MATAAIVLALASCAQPSPGDPEAEETGPILLTEDQKAGTNGAMYIEGAVGEVILRDSAGQELSRGG
jgi:hypothetical protein